MKKRFSLFLFALLSPVATAGTPLVDQIGIAVAGTSRQFAYTNKQAGTYYGEVNGQNIGGWEGWFVNQQKLLNDYAVSANGTLLDRIAATTTVYPYQLVRKYPDGAEERFTFLDSINAFIVECKPHRAPTSDLTADLSLAAGFEKEKTAARDLVFWQKRSETGSSAVPSWIALKTTQRKAKALFVVAAASSRDEARSLCETVARNAERFIAVRKQRMENLLQESYVRTNIADLDNALMWAKLSLDALIMNQAQSGVPVKGIFAGLPWFNDYWGRDSFISLPGATFVTGNFSDARNILRSFARFQEKDSTNPNYGRIPNIVTTTSVAYNTADGTPWFAKQMYDYVKYSNDTALIADLFPVIKRSIEGTVKYHTDTLGFLTHGDAESWMDAAGPNGPWSPRGNRACEIQALWYYQLLIGSFEAEYLTEYYLAGRWKSLADKVEKNFNTYFVDREQKLVYDHLKADGTPSRELRPNQLFCMDIVNSEDIREAMVKTVTSSLIYEYGVGTLSQSDSNFHPYHHFEPAYVQDAAYHNGIVWTWLNGHAIYALTRNDEEDLTFRVTKNMVHQILHRGCVGTLSELLDAQPRVGETEPRLSGAFSQAWSLAEFIRSFYQDYLGIGIDATARALRINPKLPTDLKNVECRIRAGNAHISAHYVWTGDSVRVTLKADRLPRDYDVSYLWVYHSGDAAYLNATLTPAETLTIAHSKNVYAVRHNSTLVASSQDKTVWYLPDFSPRAEFANLALAQPAFNPNLPVFHAPSYAPLTLNDVRNKDTAAEILFDKDDPAGDDRGESGTYRYPSDANFSPGILDIVHATVSFDSANAYFTLRFRGLADPGWHPEYGFQLTIAAIAIHRGDSGATTVGVNAQHSVGSRYRFDRLIIVGGGIRVTDEKGTVLCEYTPRAGDEKNPIGSTERKSIEFSLPLEYLGKPTPEWKMTILIGAQDDHGGAGIGEFRAVDRQGGAWTGGGKLHPEDSNVYDVLILE